MKSIKIISILTGVLGFAQCANYSASNCDDAGIAIAKLIRSENLDERRVSRHFVVRGALARDSKFMNTEGQIVSLDAHSKTYFLKVGTLYLSDHDAYIGLQRGRGCVKAMREILK